MADGESKAELIIPYASIELIKAQITLFWTLEQCAVAANHLDRYLRQQGPYASSELKILHDRLTDLRTKAESAISGLKFISDKPTTEE